MKVSQDSPTFLTWYSGRSAGDHGGPSHSETHSHGHRRPQRPGADSPDAVGRGTEVALVEVRVVVDPGEGAAGGQLVVEGHQAVGWWREVVRLQGSVMLHGCWVEKRGVGQGGGGGWGVHRVPVTGRTGWLGGVAFHGRMGRCPPTLDQEHEPTGEKQKPWRTAGEQVMFLEVANQRKIIRACLQTRYNKVSFVQGLVHFQSESSIIIYSPSTCSKPAAHNVIRCWYLGYIYI